MSMEERKLICIGCPLGCGVTVTMKDGEIEKVEGYTCKRGEEYARKEVLSPTRIVTSVVYLESQKEKMLPVKTKTDIPKGKILEVMRALDQVKVKAPICIGDIIVENIAETNVSIIATKTILE